MKKKYDLSKMKRRKNPYAKRLKKQTTIRLDDALAAKAMKLGGHKAKTEAVTQALIEYVQHLEQLKIVSMFGTVDCDPDYDPKKQRSRT